MILRIKGLGMEKTGSHPLSRPARVAQEEVKGETGKFFGGFRRF